MESDPLTSSSVRSRNPAAALHCRYWWALGVIAALIVVHQVLLQPALSRLTSDAPVINIAGRQRMLSQQLTKAALAVTTANDPEVRRARERELATTLDAWRRAHRGLQQGDASLALPGANTDAVRRAFADVEPHFEAISRAAEELLESLERNAAVTKADRLRLETILDHEPRFLSRMHAIVGQYENEARQRVASLQQLGVGVMLAILCVLVAVQAVVVRPAVKMVGREFADSEAQYQRLVESMSDGLVLVDCDGQVQFANGRFRAMLGLDDRLAACRHVAAGCQPAALSLPELLPESERARLADNHGPLELCFKHAAGHAIDTIVSPQRLTARGGAPAGWLLVVTDITARKAAEERSRELLDQLTHANRLRAMGEMAAGLAHELHQPLGAIANYSEGALARLDAGNQTEQDVPLRAILRAALRGGEIIRRARCFSQLRPHEVAPESINDLAREVEQLCLPEARRRSVVITLDLASDLPLLPIDAVQIQQVLTNLIQNAFAALEDVALAQRRVAVATEPLPEGWVQVSVADSGPGVDGEIIDRLFQPFVTSRSDGLGMGLAIVRGIVETHGGRIWAERAAEGGARFCFTLPTESSTPATSEEPEVAHV